MGEAMGPDDVKSLRKRLGLTQHALAERVGVRPLSVSRWERGTHRPSHLARRALEKLADEAPAQAA